MTGTLRCCSRLRRYLAENRDFAGTVNLIFQPAEEGRGGANAMLADKLFERFPCDAIYGLHNTPGMPESSFGTTVGPFLAAADTWKVDVPRRRRPWRLAAASLHRHHLCGRRISCSGCRASSAATSPRSTRR